MVIGAIEGVSAVIMKFCKIFICKGEMFSFSLVDVKMFLKFVLLFFGVVFGCIDLSRDVSGDV